MEAPATFMEQPAIFVERTLAIIKPDAIDQSSAILRFIEDHGFAILQVSKSAVKTIPSSSCHNCFRCCIATTIVIIYVF